MAKWLVKQDINRGGGDGGLLERRGLRLVCKGEGEHNSLWKRYYGKKGEKGRLGKGRKKKKKSHFKTGGGRRGDDVFKPLGGES